LTYDLHTSEGTSDDFKDGIRLLESFLRGRSHFAVDAGENSWKLERFLMKLPRLLADCNSSGKIIIYNTLSCLLPPDWDTLGTENFVYILESVAKLGSGLGANVRADVYKALGNICSMYYDESRLDRLSKNEDKEVALCQEFINVALAGCVDQNAKARCMATFAFGNLCFAVRQNAALSFLVQDPTLANGASTVHQCLSDADDKVKGNAIRSMAHVLCLSHLKNEGGIPLPSLEHFRDALSSLARQARMSLLLLDKDAVCALTWKERQSLKKLGWGSFNALARVFEAGVARRVELSEKFEIAVQALVECVTSSLWSKSDKVFAAACSCLRSAISEGGPVVSRVLLDEGKQGGVVGRCAWSCISILLPAGLTLGDGSSGRARNSPKLRHEVEALLNVLLKSASVTDAKLVLMRFPRSNFDQYLRWLYEWIGAQRPSPVACRSIALALTNTRKTQSVDPELEIRFSIRAATQSWDSDDFEEEEM
jgi:hypothetical protein